MYLLQAAVRDNPIQKGNTKDAKSYPNVQMRSKRDIGYIKPDEIRNTNFTMTGNPDTSKKPQLIPDFNH